MYAQTVPSSLVNSVPPVTRDMMFSQVQTIPSNSVVQSVPSGTQNRVVSPGPAAQYVQTIPSNSVVRSVPSGTQNRVLSPGPAAQYAPTVPSTLVNSVPVTRDMVLSPGPAAQYVQTVPSTPVVRNVMFSQVQTIPSNSMVQSVPSGTQNMVLSPGPTALVSHNGAGVVQQSQAVAGPIVQYNQEDDWIYSNETDPRVGNNRQVKLRIYKGALLRPLLEEAYLTAHLSHQAQLSSFGNPGETLRFQSSSGRANNLMVVSISKDLADIGWRVLCDQHTNFIIFRGSADWKYPLLATQQTQLQNMGQFTEVRAHTMLLQELGWQLETILQVLDAHRKPRTVIAGHGNGGALAVLLYLLMQRSGYDRSRVTAYTFGAPLTATVNPGSKRPMPEKWSTSIHNFVNEDDLIPSMLGQKDINTVDQLIGTVENPLKSRRHLAPILSSYAPIGRFYHLDAESYMLDIPAGREKFFLDAKRGHGDLQHRLMCHAAGAYVSKLRQVVDDN
eukprot:NODE_395_length_1704_cov_392.566767_g314_i0.p1 GENE.NODE_395_length_1704_cov_392.566767_g314_i0~~NODE_395_length_1704_cov_392.566767_g314_i0.p1  ORF type:complete len:501 (+),score=75.77 NODE_395_length_1704_cov_392.566767_g314_i0:67-1569(+)